MLIIRVLASNERGGVIGSLNYNRVIIDKLRKYYKDEIMNNDLLPQFNELCSVSGAGEHNIRQIVDQALTCQATRKSGITQVI